MNTLIIDLMPPTISRLHSGAGTRSTPYAILALALILLNGWSPKTASAQSPTPVAEIEAAAGVEGTGEAPQIAQVRVDLIGENGESEPLADVAVFLEPMGIASPAQSRRFESVTDSTGLATFELPNDAMPFRATAVHEELAYNGAGPVIAGLPEPAVVPVFALSADPSAIRATRVITMLSLHEEYLVVEQHFALEVDAPYAYWAGDDPREGLEIRMPEGAEGIRVLEPQEAGHVLAGDSGVVVRGPIGPEGSLRSEGSFVTLRYSLPNTSTRFMFEQPMPFPVDEAMILVPQETDFDRYPLLDVDLRVPQCGQSASSDEVVCFGSVDTQQAPVALLPGVDRREVWGGIGAAGSVLRFETVGWPSYRDLFPTAALIGMIAILLIGAVVIVRHVQRGSLSASSDRAPKRELEAIRYKLLQELLEIRAEYEAGYLPKSEFETTDLIIRNRLEAVYSALGLDPDDSREFDGSRPTASPSGSENARS